MRWLIGLLLGVFSQAQSIGGPLGQAAAARRRRVTLTSRGVYAQALYYAGGETLDGLREAVNELEDVVRIARRVFGGANPVAFGFVGQLRAWRSTLAAREMPAASA